MREESAVSATAVQTTTIEPESSAGPPTPQHAAFVEAQDRLLRHYGVRARSRYVHIERPPMRAHVLEAGQGEPTIILHGGDGQGVDWAPLMAHLQDGFHLHALDRPGYGLSDPFDYRRVDLRRHAADFVASTLDALELEQATILGGSMGGFFALATAFERPERVRALVLVGMPVGLSRQIAFPMRILCGVPGLANLFVTRVGRPTADARKKQYETMFHVDPATVPEVYFDMQVAGMRVPGALPTWAVLLRRVAGLSGMRPEVTFAEELPRLEVPTLVIWGEHDMAPMEAGRDATELMPKGRFEYLPGVGHFPFLEVPDQTARLIREFIATSAREV
jgi:pimeloyl-ACP methyl ester carboxylesterase